ncbi:glycosyltransferase family 2 protein [Dysgonomonas sp. 520]|uniref:glycosyltransferase family 2 protein n=1 Tax=Dysgonomonas sp. 520 TaxID=2302931 RepID=UPI0013D8AF69|nr:glycosyltransferase family 2 protein [Dysgonomonas sp. 520]NDW10671.1 glycosyltransferase family 2 protein [Dysgonomonas sp. 520]
MKKVSVVILNWNGRKLLEQFLPSVTKYSQGDSVDIIVADNNSSDDSVSFIRENYPSVKLILLPDNYGYAGGYNKALAQVDSEYVVLLNSDVEVTENWLDPMISHLDDNRDVAALQPKVLAQREKHFFEYAGAAGGFIDKLGYPFCRGRLFSEVEKDNGQYDTTIDIFWATGACITIRLKDYLDAGGLDESFFAHQEEIDLCWRLNARGRKVVCIPTSVVYHVGGATLSESSPHKTFLNFRNNLLMMYKNMPSKRLNLVLWMRYFLDLLAAFQMLITGQVSNAKAVLKANQEFRKIKSNYRQTRKENLSKTVNKTTITIYPRSLLWDYYIRRRKKFSRLKF